LVSLGITTLTWLIPDPIVRFLFGPAYVSIDPLLWPYALATAFYALANVVLTYRLSTGSGGGSMLALLAGVAQIAGIWLLHSSLRQVVWVQVYIMGGLFVAILLWDLWLLRRSVRRVRPRAPDPGTSAPAIDNRPGRLSGGSIYSQ